jgi:hypothetical protein
MEMPAGADPKREREYEALKEKFKQEHRYPGREEEVAARIVNKQRKQYGETRDEREKDAAGKSPDRNLPIDDYDELTVEEVSERLTRLSPADVDKIRTYEAGHKNRSTLLEQIDRHRESD